MAPAESHLEQARRHVAAAKERVSAQERLVSELARDGHDTTKAAALLETLKATLVAMLDHLAQEEHRAQPSE